MLLTIIAFIVVLGVLVLVHELGHFIAAKLSGIKVEEFSIGFPPRIFSFKKGETRYTIGALPLGGYVKMLGEDSSSKDPRAFNNQSAIKRLIIGVAGVFMNIILAWFLLTIGFSIGMTPIMSTPEQINGKEVKTEIYVAQVNGGSPAEKAGIEVGDKLVGTSSENFKSLNDVVNLTHNNLGKEIRLKVERNKTIQEKTVRLSTDKNGPLGTGLIDQVTIKVPWYKAPLVALEESYRVLKYTFIFLGQFAKQLFTAGTISNDVGGPVAIFTLSGAAARAGIIVLIQFIAILSINLALINILPFPALDGGRVLFILLEKIAGRRIVKEQVEGMIHMIGFVLLILLVLAITYKDIVRLFQK